MTEDELSKLIQDVEDAIVDDSPEVAAEGMTHLAETWAAAGIPYASFLDMRKHLIESAERRTSRAFIREKLTVVEQQMRQQRDIKNITVH